MRATLQLTASLALLLGAAAAAANEIPCSPVQQGTIHLDGLLGDWKGVDGVGVDQEAQILKGREEWSGPADLSFDVFCNYADEGLYLAIHVRDEYFIRNKKAGAGDDHLGVEFAGATLIVYPGNLRDAPARLSWGRSGKARGVKMAEAMQPGGYSVELFLPWKVVPGYREGAPSLAGAVWVADCDSRAKARTQTLMATAPSARQGTFAFAQAKVDLQGFLKDKGYSAGDVRTRVSADVVGDGRLEQVLLVGRTIGVIGEGLPGGSYFYLDLPVRSGRDIYWLKAMDLNGDGKAELVTRYTERAGNGRRELLAVYRFNEAEKFVRWFAHEVLKGQGNRTIVNRFAFKPWKGKKAKGKRKGGGIDIIIDKPVATGFSAQTYQEDPSSDCFSILLPWGEDKKRHFRFDGEEFQQL